MERKTVGVAHEQQPGLAELKLAEQEIQCLYKQLGRSDKVTHPEMLEELGKIDENRSLNKYF